MSGILRKARGLYDWQKIVCKKCRIERKRQHCSLIKRYGQPQKEQSGACLGFGKPFDDEPIEQCKRCIACTSFDWDEEKQRLSI